MSAKWTESSCSEYTVKVAHSIEEDKQLIEAGFEYVTERDGLKIYKKRR